MKSPTLDFANYLLGLPDASTSDTKAELDCLSHLAKDKK